MEYNWIPCKKRTPPLFVAVLVRDDDNDERPALLEWRGDAFYWTNEEDLQRNHDITKASWLDSTPPQSSKLDELNELMEANKDIAYSEIRIRFRLDTDGSHYTQWFENIDEAIAHLRRGQPVTKEQAAEAWAKVNDICKSVIGHELTSAFTVSRYFAQDSSNE